jgi:hypothetical protein
MPEPGQKIEGYYLVTVGRECGIFFTLYVLSYRCYRLLTFAPMQEGSLC